MTYSLFPHAGPYTSGAVRAACELNVPIVAVEETAHRGEAKPIFSRLSVSSCHVVVETVKKAEDDNGIIVRLYEAHGTHCACELTTSLPVKRAIESNLMDKEERPLGIRNGKMRLHFRPFEIVTVKLT